MTSYQLERALFHWPAVVNHAPNQWAENFARSIAKQSTRRGWKPTEKQAEIMTRMVNELFTENHNHGEDATVIE